MDTYARTRIVLESLAVYRYLFGAVFWIYSVQGSSTVIDDDKILQSVCKPAIQLEEEEEEEDEDKDCDHIRQDKKPTDDKIFTTIVF